MNIQSSFRASANARVAGRRIMIVAMLVALSSLLSSLLSSESVAATFESHWLLPQDGVWQDGTKWSTNPNFPNGNAFDAYVDAVSGNYTISLQSGAVVHTLTMTSPGATIDSNVGTLQCATFNLQAGTFNLQHGGISNTYINGEGGTGKLIVWSTMPYLVHDTFGIDVDLPFESQITARNGLTLANHNFNFTSGSQIVFDGSQTLDGTGQVIVNSRPNSGGFRTQLYASTGTLTIGPNITVRTGVNTGGSQGIVLGAGITGTEGNFVNQGTISCQTAGAIVQLKGSWINNGALRVSAGQLQLDGQFAPSAIGDFVRTGGSVALTGQVTATGQTLRLDSTTGSWDFYSGSGAADYGRIYGGRVEAHDGTGLHVPIQEDAYLDGVDLAAPISVDRFSLLHIYNNLSLDHATISLSAGTSTTDRTTLDFHTTTSISGIGSIVFENGGTLSQIMSLVSSGSVTFGPGITIAADTGGGRIQAQTNAPINIQGTVITGANERRITFLGPFAITGTLQVDPNGIAAVSLQNLVSNTLTGGTFIVRNGGSLGIGTVKTNGGSLVLDGAGATINNLGSLTTNAVNGSLKIVNGASLTVAGALTNDGTLVVGAGSELDVPMSMTVSSTGQVSGSGLIKGSVFNNGQISPGTSPGQLSIDGDLALGSSSLLTMELAGMSAGEFDRIAVSGGLNVGGTLRLTFIDGFIPDMASFDLFDFAGFGGNFQTIDLPTLPFDRFWDTSKLATTGVVSVVPEPACGMLCLAIGHFLRRRRR